MFEAVSGPVWTCLDQVQTCCHREEPCALRDSNPGYPTHTPTALSPCAHDSISGGAHAADCSIFCLDQVQTCLDLSGPDFPPLEPSVKNRWRPSQTPQPRSGWEMNPASRNQSRDGPTRPYSVPQRSSEPSQWVSGPGPDRSRHVQTPRSYKHREISIQTVTHIATIGLHPDAHDSISGSIPVSSSRGFSFLSGPWSRHV